MTLSDGAQTVIVAGDCRPDMGASIADLAAEAAVPLLAEPSSNARCGAAALSTVSAAAVLDACRGDRAGRGLRPADAVPAGHPAAGPRRR